MFPFLVPTGAQERSHFQSSCQHVLFLPREKQNWIIQHRRVEQLTSGRARVGCMPLARGNGTRPPSPSLASRQLFLAPLGPKAPSPAIAGVELSVAPFKTHLWKAHKSHPSENSLLIITRQRATLFRDLNKYECVVGWLFFQLVVFSM